MSNSLFRPQAIEAKTNKLVGHSHAICPLRFGVIAAIALLAALAFVGIVTFGTYTKKVTVAGYVTTSKGNVRVFSPAGGVISEMYVSDGERVVQGQSLLKVSRSYATSATAVSSMQAELLQSIREEASGLRQQIGRAHQVGRSQEDAIRLNIDNALFQIGAMKGQIVDASKRLTLAETHADRMRKLHAQQLLSDANLDVAETSVLTSRLNLVESKRELASQRAALGQLRIDLEQIPILNADRVADLQAKLRRTEQRLSETEGLHATVIVAPVDGEISSHGRRVGQHVLPDTPLLAVLPFNTDFRAESCGRRR